MLPLVIDHLSKSYGAHEVVHDLSFTAEPGRVTGFLGPNGAGKSTTMKILLDLAAADAGTARIGGSRYRDLPEPARTVGVVLEPDAFHPGRTGRNHLRILADVGGFSGRRIDEVLGLTGLSDAADRRVGGYSLGMRQRLSLAAALLGDPHVLVLDEPGNGLDPQGIHDLRAVLRERAAAGDTVFVSSHLLSEVEHLADDVVVIDHGRLVTSGALEQLQQSSVLLRSPRARELVTRLSAAGGVVEDAGGDALRVRGLSAALVGDLACNAGIALHELSAGAGSLEDMFLRWTGAPAGEVPAVTGGKGAARREEREEGVPS